MPYSENAPSRSSRLTKDAGHGVVSYFDSEGRLVQERYPYKTREGCNVQIVLARPRVKLVDCPRPRGAVLEGQSIRGAPGWVYETRAEGKSPQEEVFGASKEGIVLSDLKVLDPNTGKIILSPPGNLPFRPRLTVTRSIIYFPPDFYYFDADVSLFSHKGGLFHLSVSGGKTDQRVSLKWGILGHVSVEALAADSKGGFLFFGKRWSTRGPGWVEFAVYDLKQGREIFADRLEESCVCHNLRLAVGGAGEVAFSYDQTSITRTVVYRVGDGISKEKLP